MIGGGESPLSDWTRADDKLFEEALILFPEQEPDRWEKIASKLPGKSVAEIQEHYEALLYDITEIDAGRIEPPDYCDDSWVKGDPDSNRSNQISFGTKMKHSDAERKKGTPWTEEEHRLFLVGLEKYGKGDWRSISRNVVITRTPTQVASHAQKYFLRQNSKKKERKRSSIHDITTVDENTMAAPMTQSWIPPPGNNNPIPPPAALQPAASQFGGGSTNLEAGGAAGGGGSLGYQRFSFPM